MLVYGGQWVAVAGRRVGGSGRVPPRVSGVRRTVVAAAASDRRHPAPLAARRRRRRQQKRNRFESRHRDRQNNI